MTVYCDVSYLFSLREPMDRWHSPVARHWPAIRQMVTTFDLLHVCAAIILAAD